MVTGFKGVNLYAKNPKALVEFYTNKLGVPMLTENPERIGYDGVELGFDKREQRIWIRDENQWGKPENSATTLVFSCDDHQKTYLALMRKGVVLSPPTKTESGKWEMFVRDIEGNIILLV